MKNEKTAGNAVVFENPEFGKIRTLTDEDGEPLFCAKDVCDVLGYKTSVMPSSDMLMTLAS